MGIMAKEACKCEGMPAQNIDPNAGIAAEASSKELSSCTCIAPIR